MTSTGLCNCNIPVQRIAFQRSGSDLRLSQTMKQTDYHKTPLSDFNPHEVKSPRIYNVAASPPPQMYEKSGHIYDIQKAPDYEVHPSSKAAVGGVPRRIKKTESARQTRPQSWHNPDGSQTSKAPGFKPSQNPVAQTLPRTAPQLPPHQQTGSRLGPSPSMDSLTGMHKRPLTHVSTHSMSNLGDFKNPTERDSGYVMRRASEYDSKTSSNCELNSMGKDKDFYFVSGDKRGPNLRDLQPAETYPQVAIATQLKSQLKSAQQKAFIGRVPDTITTPESPPQTYSSSQVVVHMPQRQLARTVEVTGKLWDESTNSQQWRPDSLSPTSGHPVHRATTRMSPSPTPSEKREPPTPPQRGDSRNRTQQMNDHRKYVQDSRRSNNNGLPRSVVSPTDIPPVKLSSKQEQPRPNHRKSHSMTGETEFYTYGGEPLPSNFSSSTVSQGHGETVGARTFPGMAKNVDCLYTAVPLYVDPGSDDPDADFFPRSSPQNIPEKQQSSEYQPQSSPPTRDVVDSITKDSDPLVSALEMYMRTVVDQEEQLQGMNPEDSSTGSESPVHHPRSTLYSDNDRQLSQTLPVYVARNEENEKRRSRTSVSSMDSHSSNSHRVRSPTNRLSSDEEENNRKNSQLGSVSHRSWKNPNDFSSKKAVSDSEKQWHKIVLSVEPKLYDKYPNSEVSTDPKSEGHVRTASLIDEKLIHGNAPGIRSPISPLMMEAVTSIEPPKTETMTEAQQKDFKFLKTEGRDSGYEVDSENPIRSQQESPVQTVTETFSTDDWMKMHTAESTGGTSILSQLQKETPYNQRYTNGEPIMKSTVNHETKVEIKIDRHHGSPTNERSRQSPTRSDTSTSQARNSRPQPFCPPKSRDDFLKDMKSPTSQASKDERSTFFGSQPQLSRPSGSDTSSRHYHSSSLDLDTKATGAQLLTQSSFPPWRQSEASEDSVSSGSHTRSHSYSGGGYPSYSGPSEPRFSRIDEEQGGESSESASSSHPTIRPEQRSVSGSFRSQGSSGGDTKGHRRGTSDPNNGDPPTRPASLESRGKYPQGDTDYWHSKSKSDSEHYRKRSATEQSHKNSDPSGAYSKSHIKEALAGFYVSKRGPMRSEGSDFGSNQGTISGYESMVSLDQSSRYSSLSSLHGRQGWGMDTGEHSRQSSFSSQISHGHRDSGIVSPSESSWGPPSPNTSPPGAMDHRLRTQHRTLGLDYNHQRAASDSVQRTGRGHDTNSLGRSSRSMSDDNRPAKNLARSASMNHPSRPRPQSYHEEFRSRDGPGRGLSRTETFSLGQGRSVAPARHAPSSSATLPAGGYHSNGVRPYYQSQPIKAGSPSAKSQRSPETENVDDMPPELPPKQIKEAHLKTIAKVDSRHPQEEETGSRTRDSERERKNSAPARSVFSFSPTHVEQHRYPSPTLSSKDSSPTTQAPTRPRTRTSPSVSTTVQETSPTQLAKARSSPTLGGKEASPTHQVTTRPRTKTSPLPVSKETSVTRQAVQKNRSSPPPSSGKERSPTHTAERRNRSSPPLPPSKEASPTHPAESRTRISPTPSTASSTQSSTPRARTSPPPLTRKDSPPTYQSPPALRPRTDSFVLPPPPTPPAVPVPEDVELPSPPPEVLLDYPITQQEDKPVFEEQVSRRNDFSTHAAVSLPQSEPGHASPSASPRTSSPDSPISAEARLPAFTEPPIDPEVRPRSETPKSEVTLSPILDSRAEEAAPDSSVDVPDSRVDRSGTPSPQSRFSPVNRRPALELGLDDEAKPIEVIEIVHTPTLSPKRGQREPPGDAQEHSEDPLVDWVLNSVNPQDSALRELYKFPEEPLMLGSLADRRMPQEKKEEAQTPKRSECDVKSLTHALSSSMYLQISPAKALLLTRAKSISSSNLLQGDSKELRKTKEELISRLAQKVSDLRKEKEELLKEISIIEDLGRQVTENVRKSCKPSSLDKYLMYVGDADRVTKLLLSLSRRLAKVNSVLNSLEGIDEEEQKPDLQKMHKDLTSKYADAEGLKKSIDARHVQISSMLQDHLSAEEYEDFCYFMLHRPKLRIMAQELDDRISLGDEQLQALKDSLKGEACQAEGSLCGAAQAS